LAVAGAVLIAIVASYIAPVLGAVVALVLAVRPARHRRQRERQRTYAVAEALPDLIDLLRVAAAGGATPPGALRIVAPAAPAVLAPALGAVFDQIERGARFADAVAIIASLLGPQARPLAEALADSDRAGVPLGQALDLVAADARRERRHQAELVARRLPVQLCFPLVVCVLPSFVLLTVAPLLAGTVRAVRF
jgi:tight adherence protein C